MPETAPTHAPAPAGPSYHPLRIDRDLVRRLRASGGGDLSKCMQCATCSAVCELADEREPVPRKEMLWARWGLRERLMGDGDLWLCHQCGDCTVRCPREARPGDVMAALRRECVIYYAVPRAVGRLMNRPAGLVCVVAIACLVLAAAAIWTLSGAATSASPLGRRMALSFWPRLPYGSLVAVFLALLTLDVVVLVRGGRRFWRDLCSSGGLAGRQASHPDHHALRATLGRILWHDDFGRCRSSRARRRHHLLVVYGVLALFLTSLWVIGARWNPMLDGLVYPLAMSNPWKVMANAGGVAVLWGATLMLTEHWRRPRTAGVATYADLVLLGLLVAITLSGFAAELLHWARIEPLRFVAYAAHLISVFTLLFMLPYSKLAHTVYRTLALVHAQRGGRGKP